MAKFNVKWNGVAILLSHKEACEIMDKPVSGIIAALGMSGKPWAQAVAAVIKLQQSYIKQLNENSGGKGVRLFFNFYAGVITDVRRRGKRRTWGPSPCHVEEEVPRPALDERTGTDEAVERLVRDTGWDVDNYVSVVTRITGSGGDPADDDLVAETALRAGIVIVDPTDPEAIEARRREAHERRREP